MLERESIVRSCAQTAVQRKITVEKEPSHRPDRGTGIRVPVTSFEA
jgi:hypothetical protein